MRLAHGGPDIFLLFLPASKMAKQKLMAIVCMIIQILPIAAIPERSSITPLQAVASIPARLP